MRSTRILAALLTLSIAGSGPGLGLAGSAQPAPPAPAGARPPPPPPGVPPAPPPGAASTQAPAPAPDDLSSDPISEVTPARLSYLTGEVSFWRAGADNWAPATLNTPLAPGDILYAGPNGNVEIQIGTRAFVRAAYGTQIGLDNQDPDYIQFRVTSGQAALDLRGLSPSFTLELDTPNAAFTVDHSGYYHLEVDQDSSRLGVYRGGIATVTPAGGTAAPIAANQQGTAIGTESAQIALGAAPPLTAWDNWNYQRSGNVSQPSSTRYVGTAVYGAESLDQYGRWRTVETYGSVWVPADVAPGWVPYSTGRWIWDPRFGWTWLDQSPWGWAPYHYGRWVFVGNYWAWAPGPVAARRVYAPALVVFLGGPTVVGRPLCWAPLGWGEPVLPWWGRRGFAGVPWWGGWAGPRVVNNVVINRNTVHATNITVYRNVHVTNAVVGVPRDQFGHGTARPARVPQAELRQLAPMRGPLDVKPVAASMMPATGAAVKPPTPINARGVVATRPPHDPTPVLRDNGLPATPAPASAPAPRIVSPPRRTGAPGNVTSRAGLAPPATPTGTPQRRAPLRTAAREEKRSGVRERPTPPPGPAKPPPAQGSVPSLNGRRCRPRRHAAAPEPRVSAAPARRAPAPAPEPRPRAARRRARPGPPTPAPASPQGAAAPGQRQIAGPGQQGVPPAPPRQSAPASGTGRSADAASAGAPTGRGTPGARGGPAARPAARR